MTREFWIWQWADGEFGSFIWPSKDSATLPHRHEVGHPIQLVPKTDIEAAQKDAATDHHLVNGLREFYLGYLSQYLPLDAFERVRRTTVTAARTCSRHPRTEGQAIMTRDEIRDLVRECGLDWRRGFMPLFEGDDTNRFEVLVQAATDAALERAAEVCETILDELSFANAYECANECAEAIRALKEQSA